MTLPDAIEQPVHSLKREIDEQANSTNPNDASSEPVAKKVKVDDIDGTAESNAKVDMRDVTVGERRKGVAPIKKEFLILQENAKTATPVLDDDKAEATSHPHGANSNLPAPDAPTDSRDSRDNNDRRDKKKQRGQNKGRKFQFQHDAVQLCPHLNLSPATDKPLGCGRVRNDGTSEANADRKGGMNGCKFEHDIKKYLAEGKKPDLEGVCPVFDERGECAAGGWRCRWLGSHLKKREDGEFELVVDAERKQKYLEKIEARKLGDEPTATKNGTPEIVFEVGMEHKILLRKKKYPFPQSDPYIKVLDTFREENNAVHGDEDKAAINAAYMEANFKMSEKRRLHISANQPILAPLTTTGNLPFRRLCKSLGASITYSEMAMSLPLLEGQKSEWALLRAHVSEMPSFNAQICAMKPWQAIKATEAIVNLIPGMNSIDLNCGCPIDLVYKSGGGSALLDQPGKLVKMLRGMNYVSGATPITCKIRMGTKDASPTAKRLLHRLWENKDVAAVTLHGRSRQQRYTREADWGYIAECSTLIKGLKEQAAADTDTARESEGAEAAQAPSSGTVDGSTRNMYFVGNGDVYSHEDYWAHIEGAGVDSCMVARGALIKPWVFEEIHARQYLDKSATERLEYVREFARYGLETWGADEFGIGTTRRFLLEWLSFSCRYVPIGILEYLPPRIQDRPPSWKGRNELETLMGSHDYKDWMKISDMFLGPTPESFEFVPKHKSNSYEVEAEG